MPGITAKWNGRATVDFWTAYQWTRGSYSYWKVGQYQAFAGAERERRPTALRRGAHVVDFQGYLNGAVASGERAAGEILADISAADPLPHRTSADRRAAACLAGYSAAAMGCDRRPRCWGLRSR